MARNSDPNDPSLTADECRKVVDAAYQRLMQDVDDGAKARAALRERIRNAILGAPTYMPPAEDDLDAVTDAVMAVLDAEDDR